MTGLASRMVSLPGSAAVLSTLHSSTAAAGTDSTESISHLRATSASSRKCSPSATWNFARTRPVISRSLNSIAAAQSSLRGASVWVSTIWAVASAAKYCNSANSPDRGVGKGPVFDCRQRTGTNCSRRNGEGTSNVALPSCHDASSRRIAGSCQGWSTFKGARAPSLNTLPVP